MSNSLLAICVWLGVSISRLSRDNIYPVQISNALCGILYVYFMPSDLECRVYDIKLLK
jgi:hypothetical protein